MKKTLFSVLFMAVGMANFAQVKIGDNPTSIAPSALLELESPNKALLLPRVTSTTVIADPENGMFVYDMESRCVKTFEDGSWSDCLSGKKIIVTVSTKTGRTWMDRNLGATKMADSLTDEAAFGDLYQWGRKKDGHQKRTSSTTTVQAEDNSNAGSNFYAIESDTLSWTTNMNLNLWNGATKGVNDPCPSGFRVPTFMEFVGEVDDAVDDMAPPIPALNLTVAGFRSNGEIVLSMENMKIGGYWTSSSTLGAPTINQRDAFLIVSNQIGSFPIVAPFPSNNGLSVRCIGEVNPD